MSLVSSVWSRRSGSHDLSKNAFAALTCLWVAVGIGASAVAAHYSQAMKIGIWTAIAIGLVLPIIGILITMRTDEPLVSLLGYALVCVPFGILVGPVVALYTTASVVKVLAITCGLVIVLGVVGAVIPESLESWGSLLFGGLIVLILGSFIVPIAGMFGLPVKGAMTLLDWVGVLLFSAYVIFDLNRAMRVERTHNNAVGCALAVYLDFANIFIRLLSLTGDTKSDD